MYYDSVFLKRCVANFNPQAYKGSDQSMGLEDIKSNYKKASGQ